MFPRAICDMTLNKIMWLILVSFRFKSNTIVKFWKTSNFQSKKDLITMYGTKLAKTVNKSIMRKNIFPWVTLRNLRLLPNLNIQNKTAQTFPPTSLLLSREKWNRKWDITRLSFHSKNNPKSLEKANDEHHIYDSILFFKIFSLYAKLLQTIVWYLLVFQTWPWSRIFRMGKVVVRSVE